MAAGFNLPIRADNESIVITRLLCLTTLLYATLSAYASEIIDATLNEEILTTPSAGLFPVTLQTTLFTPNGEGPFPLVVINHGKDLGDARFQPRYRPLTAVAYFLGRGYAVAVPMRRGFAGSGGKFDAVRCNIEADGIVQAEDVRAVIDTLAKNPKIDASRTVMVGQSFGGWTALAFGALGYPGLKGLINFAGGLRQESCSAWENNLARSAGHYAEKTTVPSLWFYGDNDSLFAPLTWHRMYETYTASGGKAELIAFGSFQNDAHSLFGSAKGLPIWAPKVDAFLAKLQLPNDVIYTQYAPMTAPPATKFARLDDVSAVPFIKDKGREGYSKFLTVAMPRAFVIAPDGAWSWWTGGRDPLAKALESCRAKHQDCRLYAVDEQIVWPETAVP